MKDDFKLPDFIYQVPEKEAEDKDEKNLPTLNQDTIDSIENASASYKSGMKKGGLSIEFPQFPEITDMPNPTPFVDAITGKKAPGFRMRAAMAFTRDDNAKAEIFSNYFAKDERFGGVYSDKFNNPIVMWEEIPYYINKPGLSGTDFLTFAGEVIKFLPATKYVGGARTKRQTVKRGALAYPLTETVSRVAETSQAPQAMSSKDQTVPEILGEIGVSTGIGVGTDLALPPVASTLSTGIKAGARMGSPKLGTVAELVFPKFKPEEVLSKSKFPLTVGQRTALPPGGVTPRETSQLSREQELRRTPGSVGSDIIRGFDEKQLSEIRADALSLQEEFGAGLPGIVDNLNLPQEAAVRAQNIVAGRAGQLKEQSQTLYDNLKSLPLDQQPRMTAEGVRDTIQTVLDELPKFGISPNQILDGPLSVEVKQLRKLRTLAQNPKFKDQSLKNLHGYQKRLSIAIRNTSEEANKAALIKMKNALDDAIFNGIERGLIMGDQAVIDQLQQATGLYADYMRLTGKNIGKNANERSANNLLEQLSNKDFTPLQVANFLFGHGKFSPRQSVPMVIDTLKSVMPPQESAEVISLLKDAILVKAFANPRGETTRTAIVNNFNDVFVKQKPIIERLFTPEEITKVKEFRKNVMPTLWAEINSNPSGTAYTLLGALQRKGFFNFPLVGPKIEEAVKTAEDFGAAKDALRQKVARSSAPLLSNATQAALRDNLLEQSTPDLPELDETRIQMENFEMPREIDVSPTQQIDVFEEPEQRPLSMSLPTFDPLPVEADTSMAVNPALSPTLLPSEADREIAMRMQQPGIAGLVV